MSTNIKRARAAMTPEVVESYFDELSNAVKDISPEALFNYDKTSVQNNKSLSGEHASTQSASLITQNQVFQNVIYKENINKSGASTSAPISQINNSVIVKFFYDEGRRNESIKHFIRKVTDEDEKRETLEITSLRNYRASPNTFDFPDVEDCDEIESHRIIRVLKPIAEMNGRYTFDIVL
ncbi:hypothetical protein ILUMI_19576 [Ignelater luminosus]|uniref:Uncharacterized protein n=1 Tax=Ignelater luminosus TaxID=2038154 RepID=A0A8K0CJ12_IGNLU|nr:hypothetical protein ILUMI_19576 [Ignelater luminosus]